MAFGGVEDGGLLVGEAANGKFPGTRCNLVLRVDVGGFGLGGGVGLRLVQFRKIGPIGFLRCQLEENLAFYGVEGILTWVS